MSRSTAASGSHMPSGVAPKAMLEVGDAPADLRAAVARRAQRQDGVAVGLRDGVAVAAPAQARRVGLEDLGVGLGVRALEPREQRGAEVEREVLVVVDDVADAVLAGLDARGAVGPVALGG